MTRLLRSILLTGLVAAATGACATTMNVSAHVQRGLDFSQYRTYDWGPADALPTGDPRLDQDPFFKDRVQGAVERALTARGYQLSSSGTPDLLIHYHASVDRRLDVNRTDSEYGYCYDEDCQVRVFDYDAGTLVLDVVDTRTKRVVWRGWAQDSVEGVLGNEDRLGPKIDEAVRRMLERFPGRAAPAGESRR